MFKTFREILDLWRSVPGGDLSVAADEIGAKHANVLKWHQRDWIPPEWWGRTIAALRRREIVVTESNLIALAESRAERKLEGAA